MKAYQIKLELIDSKPLIWRQVIMPSQTSFAGLHTLIQNVFNFGDTHLYMFHLLRRDLKVTNDHKAYQAHQEYRDNHGELEKALGALGTTFAENQLKAMRTEVFKPEDISIDPYLQEEAELLYVYDFASQWEVRITWEKEVKNYTLAYPTLLDGEQAAPPEGIGGLSKFYDFLEVYRDRNHPDHAQAYKWAKQQGFGTYDSEYITKKLQGKV